MPDITDADAIARRAAMVAEHHAVELVDTLRALDAVVQMLLPDLDRTQAAEFRAAHRNAKRLLRAIDAMEVPEPAPVAPHTRLAPAHDH